jgi:hypothetical protein
MGKGGEEEGERREGKRGKARMRDGDHRRS